MNAFGTALTIVKTHGALSVDQLVQLGLSLRGLSDEQLDALKINHNLSASMATQAMEYAKVDQEIIDSVVDHMKITKVIDDEDEMTKTLTFDFDALSEAIKFNAKQMGKWLTGTTAGRFMIIAAAVTAVIGIISHFTTTAEEQIEIFNKMQAAHEQSAAELDELGAELDSVKGKLKELNKLAENGRLTQDQEAERRDLEATNAELTRQIILKTKLAEIDGKAASDAAVGSIQKQTYTIGSGEITTTDDGVLLTGTSLVDGATAIQHYIDKIEQANQEKKRLEDEFAALPEGSADAEAYRQSIAAIDAEILGYQSSAKTIVEEQQIWADAISDTSGANYELKQSVYDVIDAWLLLNATETEAMAFVRSKASDEIKIAADRLAAMRNLPELPDGSYTDQLNAFKTSFSDFVDVAVQAGVISGTTTEDIQHLIDVLAQVPEVGTLNLFTPDLESHLKKLNAVEEQMTDLSEALGAFHENGILMPSEIADLTETFGDMEAFENFVAVLGDSDSTFAEAQKATNALAEEYLNSSNILGNMTEATADATVAQLKKLGVTNAEEVVEQRLIALKLEATLKSQGLATAEWDEVKAKLTSAGATETEIAALQALKVAKLKVKVESVDFLTVNATTIAGLMKEAQAAGLATSAYSALLKMKSLENSKELEGLTFSQRTEKLNDLVHQIQKDLMDFDAEIETPTLKVPSSYGDDADKAAIEKVKKAFQVEYDAWRHKVDMQEKTIQEFYAWLDGADGYKKYFTNEKDFLEEIQKYEKEVFDGRKEILESYLQDCDHSISILERQAERQIRNAEKVVESQETAAQRLASLRSEMEENFGEGNVDLTARVRVENDDGSYSTVASEWLSQEIADQEVAIHYTPILDGKFLDDDVLDSYIKELYSGAESAMEILERDKVENGGLGLVLRVKADFDFSEEQAWGEELHLIQEEYYDLQNAISSGTIDPNQKMIATAPDRLAVQNEIIALYRQEQTEIHKAIDELERYLKSVGLSDDEIARNDLMQEYVKMLYEAEDAIIEIQDAVHEEITGNLNDLIDLTEEMIRQEKEDQIDALEKQKDAYREIIDLQKKMLESSKKESDYKDSIAEKTKRLAEIENDLAALGRDTSREARLEEGALLEEQAELQKELADLQRDHHLEAAQEALDKEYDEFEKTQDAKIDKINDFLDDNLAVNKAAIAELDTMNEELYDRLTEYALHYTDTTKAELLDMWETASAAAEKYGSITNASQVYEDNDVDNEVQSILRQMRANGAAYGSASKEEKEALAADSERLGEELEAILKVDVHRDNNGVWWIGNEKLFEVFKYHTGTASVGGNATLKQNEVFAKLEEGESVLTSGHQNFLHKVFNFDFASAMKSITDPIAQMFKSAQRSVPVNDNRATTIHVEAPIHITGDLTNETMRIIKQHPREISDVVSKQLRML